MIEYKLIEHPFYKAWNEGNIPLTKLTEYAKSYLQLIEKIPEWWEKILDEYALNKTEYNQIIDDEKSHIQLWHQWADQLPSTNHFPDMNNPITQLDNLSIDELLGAIHSFEVQQPEIAKLKKEVLIKFYNFDENKLTYFDEHIAEEKHIQAALFIANNYANHSKFMSGYKKGSKIFYKVLDNFL